MKSAHSFELRRDPEPDHCPCSSRRIHYSERYSDDEFEYRHVILPKPLLKLIPKQYFNPDESGVLRLLAENEWRGIGITQSLGWEHYEVHGELSVTITSLSHPRVLYGAELTSITLLRTLQHLNLTYCCSVVRRILMPPLPKHNSLHSSSNSSNRR